MRPLLSGSAVVLVLGLAGAVIVLAQHDDPRRPVNLAQATPPTSGAGPVVAAPASAALPASGAPTPRFEPPPDSAIPDNDFGKEVKLGQAIFNGTSPLAAPFVGNSLRCASWLCLSGWLFRV